ncbi:LOW QUALITY PROTEIN: hypothetical protein RJ639_044458 [Escallonia herrerae]|uniref:Retrotransposon Copia-like N-terminal domain-containing protein n=1 Tax=Escallonia herrerae TaxID=1293975 RepID=A0AA88WCS5_9ASTE|nr:LOW QUALITY PROTEIN: hypothetical protein RJ639_044458 [Escallonia herrerae]
MPVQMDPFERYCYNPSLRWKLEVEDYFIKAYGPDHFSRISNALTEDVGGEGLASVMLQYEAVEMLLILFNDVSSEMVMMPLNFAIPEKMCWSSAVCSNTALDPLKAGVQSGPICKCQLPGLDYVVFVRGSGPHSIDYKHTEDKPLKEVIVSRKCAEAVLRGAQLSSINAKRSFMFHVYVPGVLACSAHVEKGDVVAVSVAVEQAGLDGGWGTDPHFYVRNGLYIGQGTTMMSRAGMFRILEGVAVDMSNRVFSLASFNDVLEGEIFLQNLPSIITAHALGVGGLPTHGNSESSILPITGHKLNGLNYLQWSQSVFMFISGKGKEDYLTGTIETPSKDDPNYKKWNSENHMVMSWLINTMNLEIGQNFMFNGTAKEVWENVKETYSDNDNTSELFEIKGILHNLQQGDASVTQYYNLLTRYWQQLDMFEKITWDCQLDKKKYDKIVEKERIFKLLLGLNKDLDEVRGRILGTKPLPSLREAFSEVRREESRKKIMMGRPGIQNSGESSALAAYGTNYKGSDNQPHKGRPWRSVGKSMANPLIGNQGNLDLKNRGYVATTEEKPISEDVVFSKEQLELLQNMFNQAQINPPVIESRTIAQKGIFPSALNSKVEKSNPWDQDSGKMIGNAKECAGLYLLKDGNLVNETRTDQKPRDNEVDHPILPEPYQDPNPSTVPAESDWAGSITDRRSTSGYCTYVWGNLVTWRSKKQSVVSRSSAEAEFRAIALSICEGMWLKRLLEELKITCEGSIKVLCDNQASINIAKNPVHHAMTKHVEIDRHFIREKIEGGIIQMVLDIQKLAAEMGLNCITTCKLDALKAVRQKTKPNDRTSVSSIEAVGSTSQNSGLLNLETESSSSVAAEALDTNATSENICKYLESLESLKSHAKYQKRMFDQAVQLVRSGGVIVYSTTSKWQRNRRLLVMKSETARTGDGHDEKRADGWHPRVGGSGLIGSCKLPNGYVEEWLRHGEENLVQRFDPSSPLDTIGFFIAKFNVGPKDT